MLSIPHHLAPARTRVSDIFICLPNRKVCPFKGQVDTNLLTSGVQATISGSLPGAHARPETQQGCDVVSGMDQIWGRAGSQHVHSVVPLIIVHVLFLVLTLFCGF